MNDLTEKQRDQLWNAIVWVRDGAERSANDAATDDIIDGIIDSGFLHQIITAERTRIASAIEALHYDAPAARIAQATAARIARQGGAL